MTLVNGVASVRLLSCMLNSWSMKMKTVIVTAQAALMNPRRMIVASTPSDYEPHCALILMICSSMLFAILVNDSMLMDRS